jgi:hypothetical protein
MKPVNADREMIEHWMRLVSSESYSTQEFYAALEAAVSSQQCPGLVPSRVEFSEGGPLSASREYLRFARERMVFDVCAAPVGVNYFFSYRFYVLLPVVKPWQVVAVALSVGLILYLSMRTFGPFLGIFALGALLALTVWFMRNAVGLGLRNLDAALLDSPIFGPIYERYFRKDTYYRQDMRMAYGSIVSGIVKGEVERVTAAKGPTLIRDYSYSPIFDGLYHAKRAGPKEE